MPGSRRSPGEENGNPLQYSCLENPKDRGACQATVHGVTESRTQLSDFTHFTTASIVYIPKIHKVHTFIYTHTILKTQKYDDSCIHSSDEEKGYRHLAEAPASFHVCLNFVLIILLLSFRCFIPLLISKLQRQIVCFKISYEWKYRICSLASHFFYWIVCL